MQKQLRLFWWDYMINYNEMEVENEKRIYRRHEHKRKILSSVHKLSNTEAELKKACIYSKLTNIEHEY